MLEACGPASAAARPRIYGFRASPSLVPRRRARATLPKLTS
jgi:hypothetical protein